jgi:large subunit ribosomal protein L17
MAYAKLGRDSAARKALFRDLATDLIINERIQTTHSKAKALRPIVEKMITLAKRGDLHARRQVAAFVRNEIVDLEAAKEERQDAVQKLFDDVAKRYAERQGGYTRVLKVGPRKGDGAEMAIIELVK